MGVFLFKKKKYAQSITFHYFWQKITLLIRYDTKRYDTDTKSGYIY